MRKVVGVDEVYAETSYPESGVVGGASDPYFPNLLRVQFNGVTATIEHVLGKSLRAGGLVTHPVGQQTQTMHMDKLPVWIQRRIATLSTIGTTPPMPDIPGVGRRISEDVYWVYFSVTDNRGYNGDDS
jgi:hypothetical protein